MPRHTAFSLIACSLVAAAALTAACGGASDRREYKLHGQILSVADDKQQATIKHDEIKGFMPGMTMPYRTRDAKEFGSVIPGDIVDATLVVVSNDAYLKDVAKVGRAPLEAPPAADLRDDGARRAPSIDDSGAHVHDEERSAGTIVALQVIPVGQPCDAIYVDSKK